MACALPAIATASLGPASIIEDGRTGWTVPTGDGMRLAQVLTEAINDSSERSRRGRLARRTVSERFTWSSVSDEFAAVLSEVAGTLDEPGAQGVGPAST
jgi:glycosyltransferase involved in cell wall biosynthesis